MKDGPEERGPGSRVREWVRITHASWYPPGQTNKEPATRVIQAFAHLPAACGD
jgi:hypothetical protein